MEQFINVLEQSSKYRHLEKMSVHELLVNMNAEDKEVPLAVEKAISSIEALVSAAADKLLAGGRMFYIGAGTSGRLGILDASEIPPTYGMSAGIVMGIIAGGEKAIRIPIENAEDDEGAGLEETSRHIIFLQKTSL